MKWFPLNNKTHYSLCLGYQKPKSLTEFCVDKGIDACGIMDYKTLSGAVSHFSACKKSGIKPIIGMELDNSSLVAKNKNGWLELIEIASSLKEGVPNMEMLKEYCSGKNLVTINKPNVTTPIIGNEAYTFDGLDPMYYTKSEEKQLHQILISIGEKTTLRVSQRGPNSKFFNREDRSVEKYVDSEVSSNLRSIYESCEDYNILHAPMLPRFPCKGTEEEFLKEVCRQGWREHLGRTGKVKDPVMKQVYADRFQMELAVIREANLFGYFLIVYDIIRYCNSNGWMTGPGRGSAAGCLLSYLMGITQVDPVEYDLIFERFYNLGRVADGRAELPDIDMDVPAKRRDEIILYLKDKYDHNKVSQMLTFGRLQGRSAVKAVLGAHEACSFHEVNIATKFIPDEADISDQLSLMDEEDRSITRWALQNRTKQLRDFAYITESGEVEGRFGSYFQQAIDLEGTFKSQGKHAAGVVISAKDLHTVCPMVDQKNGVEKIAGLEMNDLEALGQVKFDVLGLNLLDRLMRIDEIEETRGLSI